MMWFLALLLSAPGFAQRSKPAPPQKWPIETLTVEGLKNYSPQQALAVTGLKIGQLASTQDFEAARDRLLATGVFETAGYRFAPAPGSSGYAASFQVAEVEPVYPVRFEGLNAPDSDLAAMLRQRDPFFGPKIPATEAILKRHAAALEQYLAAKGAQQKVEAKVVADSPEQFAIVFRSGLGAPKVAEVRFRGNSVVSSEILLNSFAGVAYGTVYSEPAFRQLLDSAIRPIYDARGRIRVAFPKLETEKAKSVEGLIVTATVDEGATYDLGEVRLEGNSPIPAKELVKAGGFKSGDLANFDDVTAGLDRMKKRLRREGYMRASLTAERHIDDKKKVVDLSIRPEPGPQFLFGSLAVEGLDIHGEAAVKKMWGLKIGGPFDMDYPDYFLAQIREQGLFDGLGATHSSTKVDDQTQLVAVTLVFQASKEFDGVSPARSRRPGP